MSRGLCWLRRDLRLEDHCALSHCLRNHQAVTLCFVFDPHILDPLKRKSTQDRRVQFIVESLLELDHVLRQYGSCVIIRQGDPVRIIPELVQTHAIDAVYFNRDYTPYARQRDEQVQNTVGCPVYTFQDHVIHEPEAIVTQHQTPYHVFTPYAKSWQTQLTDNSLQAHSTEGLQQCIEPMPDEHRWDNAESLMAWVGFEDSPSSLKGGREAGLQRLHTFMNRSVDTYHLHRDQWAIEGTSLLSVYLRHGCVSIREVVSLAVQRSSEGSQKWITELIWREFYHMIFYHYPEVDTMPFQKKFHPLQWHADEALLKAFKEGQTGFPIIDAAMRCLNQTGLMHNRLRMLCASFLTKILLVDWKRGERYFSWKLLDYELPSNNGGWQWCAGIGCDAAPYFRIFNPMTQSKTHDPEGSFIRRYCPELQLLDNQSIHFPKDAKRLPLSFELGRDYPYPVVEYALQRRKALAFFGSSLSASTK